MISPKELDLLVTDLLHGKTLSCVDYDALSLHSKTQLKKRLKDQKCILTDGFNGWIAFPEDP
jgi:hypothetical protein